MQCPKWDKHRASSCGTCSSMIHLRKWCSPGHGTSWHWPCFSLATREEGLSGEQRIIVTRQQSTWCNDHVPWTATNNKNTVCFICCNTHHRCNQLKGMTSPWLAPRFFKQEHSSSQQREGHANASLAEPLSNATFGFCSFWAHNFHLQTAQTACCFQQSASLFSVLIKVCIFHCSHLCWNQSLRAIIDLGIEKHEIILLQFLLSKHVAKMLNMLKLVAAKTTPLPCFHAFAVHHDGSTFLALNDWHVDQIPCSCSTSFLFWLGVHLVTFLQGAQRQTNWCLVFW